jgi:hypothetical protein
MIDSLISGIFFSQKHLFIKLFNFLVKRFVFFVLKIQNESIFLFNNTGIKDVTCNNTL